MEKEEVLIRLEVSEVDRVELGVVGLGCLLRAGDARVVSIAEQVSLAGP